MTRTKHGIGVATLDNRYVNVTGDTMTGNLIINASLGVGKDISVINQNYIIDAFQVYTDTSLEHRALSFSIASNPSSISSASFLGLSGFAQHDANFNITGAMYGGFLGSRLASSASASAMYGLYCEVQGTSTGTINFFTGVVASINQSGAGTASYGYCLNTNATVASGGTIGSLFQLYIPNPNGAGTVTSNYGIFLEDQTKASTNYAIYTGLGDNVFGDDIIQNRNDSDKHWWGAGKDMSIYYDGTNGYIKTSEIAASDLHITCGTAKTLVLDTPVYRDIQFPIASGKVPAANFPTWETFTTNTSAYSFTVNDFIDLQGDEIHHGWSEGTSGIVHVHIAPKTAQTSGSNQYAKFTVYLAIADENGVWGEIGPFTAELTIPTGTIALTHFRLDVGTATLTGYHVGMQIKARVKRIAATGGTEYASNTFITQVGIHVQDVRLGSRTASAA